ncbi:GNAT family N-acetyltransferase [Exiguobacterium aurantiacum]|uniref:GNAT family N-acetyltransferase n=1 Tax=Exiguobacterium aurantiacum TaxID=33987 RepID=UPI00384F655B
MEVYQATIADIEGVSRLFDSYRMFYEKQSDVEGAKSYMKARIENKESVIFVVKNEQEYLGFIQLYPTFSSISMNKSWILNDMFVKEEARNFGVGQLLLDQARDFAMELGDQGISLETAPENTAAQRLYEKNGYEQDTQFLHYVLRLM